MAKIKITPSQKLMGAVGYVTGYGGGTLFALMVSNYFGLSMFAKSVTPSFLYLKIAFCLISIVLLIFTTRNGEMDKQKNGADFLSPRYSFLTNLWAGAVSVALIFLIIPIIG
ncbi:MAG: hypothetical protein HY867_08225 [Chloroflexi bacterium]|nr:hypothetical protein [Chloroflexota bacterium]